MRTGPRTNPVHKWTGLDQEQVGPFLKRAYVDRSVRTMVRADLDRSAPARPFYNTT